MAKAEATVEELVGMIQRGELRLPEMQRKYVWRSTRVRDLLDSLYRGYPSGAILLWETEEAVPQREFAVDQAQNPYHTKRLLLDGQQRLTSLSAVIRGEAIEVRGRKRPVELLFNLEHPDHLALVTEVDDDMEETEDEDVSEDEVDSTEDELQARFERMTFVVSTRKLEAIAHWVKVSEVFRESSDAPFLGKAGVTSFDDPRYVKYSQRLARLRGIRKYAYRMDILERTLSYDEVTEIFVRVNSLGAKLRGSDLALAQITAKWPGSLKVFMDFEKKCAKKGFEFDLGIHLRNLMAHASGQSRFLTVGGMSPDRLKSAWDSCVPGMEFALNFLKSNTGIDSPALLSSHSIVVTLSYFGHERGYQLSPREEKDLRYWVLTANAKGRYSRGSSETLIDQDLLIIRNGGGVAELTERLRQQVGRLDIAPEELEGRNQRSALFKTMFLAFRESGAKDWKSQLAISLDHSGSQHRLQFHHFFPKGVLKGHYPPKDIDDIANLTFISGKTNRAISDKQPAIYLPPLMKVLGHEPFLAQCIPINEELLTRDRYRDFIAERRRRISARLNEFLRGE